MVLTVDGGSDSVSVSSATVSASSSSLSGSGSVKRSFFLGPRFDDGDTNEPLNICISRVSRMFSSGSQVL